MFVIKIFVFVCFINVIYEIFYCVWKVFILFDFRLFILLIIVKWKGLFSDVNECILENYEIFFGINFMIVIWIENYFLNIYYVGYIYEKYV